MSAPSGALGNAKGHATLTVRDPLIETMLGSFNLDLASDEINEVRRWSNAFLRSRQAWAERNRGGRRYSDQTDVRPYGREARNGR